MRLAFALLVCLTSIGGCNAVWGIEAADGVLEDSAVDPCAPQSGVAKVCLVFSAPAHPAYDVSSGAEALRIDGSGKIVLYVFDENPSDPAAPYSSRQELPLGGGEIKVDSFPATIPLPLTRGKHWFIAKYEDNKTTSRVGADSYLAGDFVAVPSRNSLGEFVYPAVTAVMDDAVTADIALQPLRRVNVDVQADPSLRTTYSTFQVNGDGPITYALFDGAFSSGTNWLELLSSDCVDAQPLATAPPLLRTGFTTVVTGTHNLVASLEDYDSTSRFPTNGSLLTPSDDPIPSITISPTSWTANTSLKFVKVLNPYKAGEKADEQRCP